MDPTFLFGLGKIRIMRIGIICIGGDSDLPICPVYTKIRITHVRIKLPVLTRRLLNINQDIDLLMV